MIKNTGSYFIYEKEKTLDTKTTLNSMSEQQIIQDLKTIMKDMNISKNYNNNNNDDDDDNDDSSIENIIIDKLDKLLNKSIIKYLETYNKYNDLENIGEFTEFVSIVYKYIVLVLIICKYNQIDITNEFIKNTIEYCLQYLFEKLDINVQIIYDTLKNTLNIEKFNDIYKNLDIILNKSDELQILYNIKLNQLTMKKYKSKIDYLISSNIEKPKSVIEQDIIVEDITKNLQLNDKKLIPNIDIDKLSTNLEDESSEQDLSTTESQQLIQQTAKEKEAQIAKEKEAQNGAKEKEVVFLKKKKNILNKNVL